MAYRRHLWSLGLGVAEAMDTAQRGMGLDWNASLELIRRSLAEAKAFSGDAGVSIDLPFFDDSYTESFEVAFPSVGGVVEIWPVETFQLYGEASWEVGYDDADMLDAELAARYYPVKMLGLGVGYRVMELDGTIDNVVLNVDWKGFFLSGVLTF